MKIKIEQVQPAHPYPIATVTIPSGGTVKPGEQLRCGGYRFEVVQVLGTQDAQQVGLQLKSECGVRPGMVLRPATAELEPDEIASMLARVTHLLQCLCEMDSANMAKLLGNASVLAQDNSLETPNALMGDAIVPLCRWLNDEGALVHFARIFMWLDDVKSCLPPISTQRQLGKIAAELNTKLKVIQCSGDTRAEIGS